jgi:hypothetical protein
VAEAAVAAGTAEDEGTAVVDGREVVAGAAVAETVVAA